MFNPAVCSGPLPAGHPPGSSEGLTAALHLSSSSNSRSSSSRAAVPAGGLLPGCVAGGQAAVQCSQSYWAALYPEPSQHEEGGCGFGGSGSSGFICTLRRRLTDLHLIIIFKLEFGQSASVTSGPHCLCKYVDCTVWGFLYVLFTCYRQ